MAKLFKKEQNIFIADIISAKSFRKRIQGLTVYSDLKENKAFWITACPSVHTFFMKFSIDVVFTDMHFKVLTLFQEVKARKILFGGFKSWNVFEMKAGRIADCQLKKGDFLYVES